MNVTEYMSEAGFRALIRDPKAVRSWPQQQMIGFDKTIVSDSELDALARLSRLHGEAQARGKGSAARGAGAMSEASLA